jgi:hypothetical protein
MLKRWMHEYIEQVEIVTEKIETANQGRGREQDAHL